mmetsp:Transcript_11398/g.22368  ORF Transcript_11398/g.22368 Transcript_11398/m.22368 type:complete len:373 (+) Transcript_11398:909-2027(+)
MNGTKYVRLDSEVRANIYIRLTNNLMTDVRPRQCLLFTISSVHLMFKTKIKENDDETKFWSFKPEDVTRIASYDFNMQKAKKFFNGRLVEVCPGYFKEIRQTCGITDAQIMNSFDPGLNSEALEEHAGNKGGKSGAFLYISYDHRFIIKTMSDSEKETLVKLLPTLKTHISNLSGESRLARIYGVYSVQRAAKDSFFILIMECLLPPEIDVIFDLKGSMSGRRKLKDPTIRRIEDIRKGLICKDQDLIQTQKTLSLETSEFLKLRSILEADVKLLSEHQLMDYSLLVGISTKKAPVKGFEHSALVSPSGYILYIGIIDYLQSFNYRKRLETLGLEIRGKDAASCCEPNKYGSRFFAFLMGVFVPCYSPHGPC